MKKIKVVTIVGARPQFIKAAAVSRQMVLHSSQITEIIIHTGQHFDSNMSDVFFNEMDIPKPEFNLGIGGGTHGQNTGRMIEKIEQLFIEIKPDWVLVYGDTDSTLAGAVAAAKLNIPIAHVEAGLRSHNRKMPEEINRILTDHASDLLFTPTDLATENLGHEGIPINRIRQIGDVMYDAALYYSKKISGHDAILGKLGIKNEKYVLATIHRAENVDDKIKLSAILDGFGKSGLDIILPLHPRTRKKIDEFQLVLPHNIRVIDPVGYLDMVVLQKNAFAIVTDSGGVQKEAYFHKIHCITTREETEWIELVKCGANRLTGANSGLIADSLTKIQQLSNDVFKNQFYGDGNSGEKLIMEILNY